jgi:uncharacterized DUF497 family protein
MVEPNGQADVADCFWQIIHLRIDIVYISGYTLMDVRITLHNIVFEWDSRKAATNVRKHDVSFEAACEAFFDPFLRYLEDEILEGELREIIIGMTENWRLLYVVYVLRDDTVRIISARKVIKSERTWYENQ